MKEKKEEEEKPKPKTWFAIHVEGIAPVKATYRVLAEDEKEASEIFETRPYEVFLQNKPVTDIKRMVKKKAIFQSMVNGLVKLIKNY